MYPRPLKNPASPLPPPPCVVLYQNSLSYQFVRSFNRCYQFVYSFNRCYLKLGDWQTALEGYSEKSIPQILQYYSAATDNDRNCYKAWHAWAYMNFETVLYYKSQQSSGADGLGTGSSCRTPPPTQTSVSAT